MVPLSGMRTRSQSPTCRAKTDQLPLWLHLLLQLCATMARASELRCAEAMAEEVHG
jgi:hypothetical protein